MDLFTLDHVYPIWRRLNLRRNLGLSTVVETVILTSVMLAILISTSLFANNILNNNMENVEFEQAIEVMSSLDDMAKKIMFKPYSSGYVKTSFLTTIPHFVETGKNLTVYVNETVLVSIPINIFKVQGGRGVGVSVNKDIVGNDSLILTDATGSSSHIHSYQSDGAWVALDYCRVRSTYSGIVELYNQETGNLEPFNLVEISVVKLTFGSIQVLEKSRIIIENMGTETKQVQDSGNLTIDVQYSGDEELVYLTDIGGNPEYPTLVRLSVICLKISILGGA
ncbi:MAG: hypothetical protein QXG97_02920 [Nitrososphaerota archaeon]